MAIKNIKVQWSETFEVFQVDLAHLRQHGQITSTAETYRGTSYPYSTTSKFKADAKGGGKLIVFYRENDNRILDGMDCRWGETILWLNKEMREGKAEWRDSAERGNTRKRFSTTDARWELISPLAAQMIRRRVSVWRAERKQKKFRDQLLIIDPRCAITGEALQAVLEAAHVRAVRLGGDDVETNGILLRADLHRLFDAKLFSIGRSGRIRVSHRLKSKKYLELFRRFPALTREAYSRVRTAWK